MLQERWGRTMVLGAIAVFWTIAAQATAETTPAKKVKITISKETTYLLGPVNPDGTIDYAAALNARYGKGVTPENNAVVGLLRAVGPDALEPEVRDRIFKLLQIAPLPEKGDYFIEWYEYALSHALKEDPDKAQEQAYNTFQKAMAAPWTAKEYPMIAKWLQANKKPLAQVAEAVNRPRYFFPFVTYSIPDGDSTRSERLFLFRFLNFNPFGV